MRQTRLSILSILAFAALASFATAGAAQGNPHEYTIGILGGFTGSPDADPSTDYDNFGVEGFFSMDLDVHTRFTVRVGQSTLDTDFSGFETDLSYLTAAGEYQFSDLFYQSSIFIGLGVYKADDALSIVDGGLVLDDENALGLTIGTAGDFRINNRLSVIVELSGHYADFDYAQFFVMGHAGFAVHF